MSEYDIWLNNTKRLWDWISQQPNLIVLKQSMGDRIYCQFDHTPQQEIAFKRQIARKLSQIDVGNNTFEDLVNQLEEIQTDQVLYMSSRQVTKTNIGTTFVNLFSDFSGRPFFADFTGFTKLAFQTYWTKVGTGVQHLRIVDDSGVIVSDLINTENLGGGTGLTTGDNPLVNYTIPAAYVRFKGKLRIQVRSTVAADDPIFEGMNIYLRR
jgi:hypothetical protein